MEIARTVGEDRFASDSRGPTIRPTSSTLTVAGDTHPSRRVRPADSIEWLGPTAWVMCANVGCCSCLPHQSWGTGLTCIAFRPFCRLIDAEGHTDASTDATSSAMQIERPVPDNKQPVSCMQVWGSRQAGRQGYTFRFECRHRFGGCGLYFEWACRPAD